LRLTLLLAAALAVALAFARGASAHGLPFLS